MADTIPHPSIDPDTFDLITVGTGLVESIIAAAASVNGKSVLQVDPNSFYGSHSSSLQLDSFGAFLESQQDARSSTPECSPCASPDYNTHILSRQHLYSNIDVCSYSPEDLKPSSSFSLDIAGPRVVFCADPMVDVMLKSGASHHLEFKAIDGSFIYIDGKLSPVPDSRGGIFKDRSLGLTEKTQMMKFFNLVQQHFKPDGEHDNVISEDDLESLFVEFLSKQRLPQKLKSIVLYSITMANYDQDPSEPCKSLVKTKDGLKTLALYHDSIGRFANTPGAFIYPIYGQGDLPQAFCRRAAVKGALQVLRMPVDALLISKENGSYKGIQLTSGQNIFSKHLLLDPSVTIPTPLSSPSTVFGHRDFECLIPVSPNSSPITKVARGVCITRSSVNPNSSNLFLVFPPRSLNAEQTATVRVLQLSSGLAVCPSGLFVLYFSTLCDDAIQGKDLIKEAINALCVVPTVPTSGGSEKFVEVLQEMGEIKAKPALLWSATYVQECKQGGSFDNVFSCPMPDGNVDYKESLKLANEIFQKMYSLDVLFPEQAGGSGNSEDEKVEHD